MVSNTSGSQNELQKRMELTVLIINYSNPKWSPKLQSPRWCMQVMTNQMENKLEMWERWMLRKMLERVKMENCGWTHRRNAEI